MQIGKIVLTVTAFVLLLIDSKAQQAVAPVSSISRAVIDSTCSVIIRNYVYPEKARAISDHIRQKLKNGAYDTMADSRRLAAVITSDIRAVQPDKHLAVRFDPELENRIRAFVATFQKDKAELEQERKQNFFFRKVEILKGNIGYIVFTGFADTNELSRSTVRAAMQFVAHTEALILDLRNNFGGRPEMAKELAAYFFSRPQLSGKSFNRINNAWTEEWIGDRPDVTQGLYLPMPLYILTSERTFSAAEGLAYNLQILKNAVVVGDTTRGGAHTTRSFALGNGFVAFVPFTRGENVLTKTDWEGTGIVPNITISEDSSLLKAQELILEHRLRMAKDEREKRKLQWLINDLKTQMLNLIVPEEIMKQYTGSFEEFFFQVENGQLFCTNTHQRNKKNVLSAITETLFKIDNESQVEFVRDKNGAVNSIRILWNDGWVDTINRSR